MHASTREPPSPIQASEIRELAERFGKAATLCVGLAAENRHDGLVDASAEMILILRRIWRIRHVAPEEVWTELDHRLQLGTLLLRLQQDARRLPRRGKGHWHPGSTKLP